MSTHEPELPPGGVSGGGAGRVRLVRRERERERERVARVGELLSSEQSRDRMPLESPVSTCSSSSLLLSASSGLAGRVSLAGPSTRLFITGQRSGDTDPARVTNSGLWRERE